jgi:hypothetical protein
MIGRRSFAGAFVLALTLVFASASEARIIQGGPDPLNEMRSLRMVLTEAGAEPVQLVFVHGIRATGPRTSDRLRKNLGARLGLACEAPSRRMLDVGTWPQTANVNHRRIWPTEADWKASQPFVERHVCKGQGATLVVDEVNWWPLLFPIKCPFLVGPESQLSGSHRQLDRCSRWIDSAALKGAPPRSLGGSKLNALAKQELLNWGFADAVIALGPMRELFRTTMDRAFEAADDTAFKETVVVAESLGSFVVLDAAAMRMPAVRRTLDRTGNLYFFANQFALLSLARIEDLDVTGVSPEAVPTARPEPSPLRAMEALSRKPSGLEAVKPVQIVAFSDPSDLLTFCVPKVRNVRVANVFVRNQWTFLGLFANPASAHTGHSQNPDVLKVVIEGTRMKGSGYDPRCYAVEP